jgi:hypothetical protein
MLPNSAPRHSAVLVVHNILYAGQSAASLVAAHDCSPLRIEVRFAPHARPKRVDEEKLAFEPPALLCEDGLPALLNINALRIVSDLAQIRGNGVLARDGIATVLAQLCDVRSILVKLGC